MNNLLWFLAGVWCQVIVVIIFQKLKGKNA